MPEKPSNKKIIYAAIAVVIAAFCATGFFLTQDIEELRNTIQEVLTKAQGSEWSFPIVLGLYVLSSAVMFPIIVMNFATAIVFGPLWGFVYAICGTLLSASVFFFIGRFGRERGLKRLLEGKKLSYLDKRFSEAGVLGIAAFRLVPTAPFGIFNMAAGVTSVTFLDYFAGTFIAFWPGGIARAVVGKSLLDLVMNPSLKSVIYLGCGVVLWAAIVVTLHFGLKKYRTRMA